MMTVWGFRLLPLCMPLAMILTHFVSYCQAINRMSLVHILSALDGVVSMAGFSALLIGRLEVNGVYVANVLNGIFCALAIVVYSWFRRKRFPCNTEQLMVIPDSFGVKEHERIDISVGNMDEVVTVSKRVMDFCRERGISGHRSYMAGLCLEEMAGNIVAHGFTKDQKRHSIDIRVAHKNDDLILRIRDDCIPFDPEERNKLTDPADMVKNMGIRMVYKAAREVQYQSILGLNVLTMRI